MDVSPHGRITVWVRAKAGQDAMNAAVLDTNRRLDVCYISETYEPKPAGGPPPRGETVLTG